LVFVCFSISDIALTNRTIGGLLLLVKGILCRLTQYFIDIQAWLSYIPFSRKHVLIKQMRMLFPRDSLHGENDDKNQTFPMYRMPDLHGDLLLAAFWRKYHEAISHPRRGRMAAGAGDQRLPGL
jgi:hypothetical protein